MNLEHCKMCRFRLFVSDDAINSKCTHEQLTNHHAASMANKLMDCEVEPGFICKSSQHHFFTLCLFFSCFDAQLS